MIATHLLRRLFLGVVLLGGSNAAHALVVDNTTTLNETAPANGAPWANVGSINGASGVYLQNGWVISAEHVTGTNGAVTINFSGSNYISTGSIITLLNPDNSPSDVVLFNIGTTPAAASDLGVVSSRPNTSTQLTMIGYGEHRNGGLTTITFTSGSTSGYNWDGVAGVESWGNNLRNSGTDSMVQAPGHNAFEAYHTTFTANGSSDTAQASLGDSGGGVFVKIGTTWELAGTMNAIGGFTGQAANTAANGDATYIADMAAYASQINAIIAIPEPQTWMLLGLAAGCFAPWAWRRYRGRAASSS